MNRFLRTSFSATAISASVLLALACGGGSSQTSSSPKSAGSATGLAYTDPTSTGWRLVKDQASTPTHLMLDLVGPAGTPTRGAAFNLQTDADKVSWGKVNDAYIEDLGIFELVADPLDPNEPRLLFGGFKGGTLSVADAQKLAIFTSKDAGQPLFRIAIDSNAAAHLHPGDAVALSVTKAKTLQDNFLSAPITIAVGTLVAQ